ncbi:NmrA family NAD(P)-binding protein [Micromonospora sp. WMMD1102]|uniref:NmrA family NAD(P)-binding protein n=1 Tax=Micromonospora sp. WMMD1102 TaxID=3016105 RepID=UPI0024158E1D|nr:NmrA family NAD(P)-binding protein [Micromonospora sp. WMMD1102]MDG4791726.1 NmrA family NAD(P)-binding protein [Micromonospora sp. WMMD1102]
MSAPTVLVLGAGGSIGSALVRELLPDHHDGRLRVVGSARRADVLRSLSSSGVEARHLDLNDAELHGLAPVLDVVRGVTLVVLITGYHVQMLAQSKAVIDAAKAAGVAHIVHVGVSAEPDTTVVHFAWHQLIEAYIERSGMGYTHLWPAAFMQNLPLNINPAAPGVLTSYVGDARTNWVDARDIAAAAAVVLRDPKAHGGVGYHLAAEAASYPELAGLLAEITGQPWRYRSGEPDEFYRNMVAAGGDPVYAACVRNVFERTRNGTLRDPDGVLPILPRLLGRPACTLRDLIEERRDDFRYDASPEQVG